ncbi:hypothetical protein U1Q18_007302 [Sarracenia purpurea var. burkii]
MPFDCVCAVILVGSVAVCSTILLLPAVVDGLSEEFAATLFAIEAVLSMSGLLLSFVAMLLSCAAILIVIAAVIGVAAACVCIFCMQECDCSAVLRSAKVCLGCFALVYSWFLLALAAVFGYFGLPPVVCLVLLLAWVFGHLSFAKCLLIQCASGAASWWSVLLFVVACSCFFAESGC